MSGAQCAGDNPATWAMNVPAPNANVASPASVLGFTPGDDYKLDSWDQVIQVYERLAQTSDRVLVRKVGKTTEGRDYLVVYISSARNLKNLEEYRQINLKITDPRTFGSSDAKAEALIAQGKLIVAATFGIHSTETASYLGGQMLAYRLASNNDPETLRILDNTIIVLVPARNPDGVDIVKQVYERRLAEGSTQSGSILINKYIGHDDNRDYVGATQPETRIELREVHNAWHPEIVHDVHQQVPYGPRLTLPPYTAPVEPNIPKSIVKGYTDLGYAIARDLHAEGFKGVQNGGSGGEEGYDDWSPLRQYPHFHNGIRILQESARVDLATPIDIDPARLHTAAQGPNFLDPWPGGKWTIGDGVNLVVAAAYSLLDHAATDREAYLRMAYENARDAVRPRKAGETAAFLIPAAANRNVLLSTLYKGGVEVRYLTSAYAAGGVTYPAGSAVVELDQPYGGYANALLSDQVYPNLRNAQGEPVRPYDVTAHTLPLLYNVPVVAVKAPFDAATTPPQEIPEAPAVLPGNLKALGRVRVGLQKLSSQDQGWVRFVLDLNGVSYSEVANKEIDAGNLNAKYDALIFVTPPGQRSTDDDAPAAPRRETRRRRSGERVLAADGQTSLVDFVKQGGTVVALSDAADAIASLFQLPVRDVTDGVDRSTYYSPGEILSAAVDSSSRLARGMSANAAVWAQNSPAFEITDPAAPGIHVVASYPADRNPLLSGWLLGADKIEGKAALVDAAVGQGHVILFGFVPLYRGLSLATYPFLFNALAASASSGAVADN